MCRQDQRLSIIGTQRRHEAPSAWGSVVCLRFHTDFPKPRGALICRDYFIPGGIGRVDAQEILEELDPVGQHFIGRMKWDRWVVVVG